MPPGASLTTRASLVLCFPLAYKPRLASGLLALPTS
jgi:hypothetical protein